jgi:alpha-mannosidase
VQDVDRERSADAGRPAIENAYLRAVIEADGTCTLLDKRGGVTYRGLNRLVDVGDRGDEYNHCPVEQDVVVSASVVSPLVCATAAGSARQTLEVSALYRAPASLGEERTERSEEYVDLPITTRYTLIQGVGRLEIETTVDNRAADHRLRAHFPVPFSVDAFQTDGHYDVVTRAVDLPRDTGTWVEQPSSTHPQREWTDVSDGSVGLMVANHGLPEVEVLRTEDGCEVALTLLRCVGWLSRHDLSVRRGHAGPGLETPEGQCIGEWTCRYAVIPHQGGWEEGAAEGRAFAAPLRAVLTSAHAGALPPQGSFVGVGPKALVLGAVKGAEDGRGMVVRLWNSSEEPCDGQVRFWTPPVRVTECTLGERDLRALEVAGDCVTVALRGREILSLRAEFA